MLSSTAIENYLFKNSICPFSLKSSIRASDLQVSWIRHRDIHILTVGTYTYTNDQRFQTVLHRGTNEWTLHIKWAQKRDAGMYECQVSTIPIKSFSVKLNIIGE